MFNGITHPSIALRTLSGEIKILKRTINVYDDTPASCFAFAYNNSTGEYAITDYYDTEDNSPDAKSCPAKVYIPDKYNGKNITYISSDAFAYKNIISVRLPINLKYIGDHTFAYNNLFLSYIHLSYVHRFLQALF